MNGDWFKLIGDVAEALGAGDEIKRGLGGVNAYLGGRSTDTGEGEGEAPYVYERWLTRPRDPRINDR
jgi:hypothetical protein